MKKKKRKEPKGNDSDRKEPYKAYFYKSLSKNPKRMQIIRT